MDNPDLIDRAKAAVSERAELPGMSLFEHLDELRRRLIHAAVALVCGYLVAVVFAPKASLPLFGSVNP